MKITKIIVFLFLSSTFVNAQKDVATFIKMGVDNASELSEAYLTPFGNAMGAGFNNSWYNTAKVHKTLGFDITFNTNFISIPDVDQTYNFNDLDLKNMELADPNANPESPTLFGDKKEGADAVFYAQDPVYGKYVFDTITMPKGLGVAAMPVPDVKLALGLPKGNEIMFRFMPEYKVWGKAEGTLNFWGLGLKHDLKQWIPGLKMVPVFNLSMMGAYSKFHFDIQPENPILPDYYGVDPNYFTYNPADYENQHIEFDANAFTANLITSVDIPFISFFASGGYNTNKTNLMFKGNFGVPDVNTQTNPVSTTVKNITDPVDVDIRNSYFQGKIGMTLKLAIIHIHGAYTLGEYQAINAGIGISFR